MIMNTTDECYTPGELAQKLSRSTKTVLNLINTKQIWPVFRYNKRVIRIPNSSVKEYLKRVTR
jgi:Helix-turn-helix domain